MPPIQTTYTDNFAAGSAGMIANQETRNVISRTVEDASLAFGKAVFQGAAANGVTATPGTVFRGISVIDRGVTPTGITNTFSQGDTAPILTLGVVWVISSVAAVAGEPVYVTPAGAFTDQASGDVALPRATFDSACAVGGLVKIRLA